MKKLNLDLIADAREYLSHFTLHGKQVHFIGTSDGRLINFDNMTDAEAVDAAKMLFTDIDSKVIPKKEDLQ